MLDFREMTYSTKGGWDSHMIEMPVPANPPEYALLWLACSILFGSNCDGHFSSFSCGYDPVPPWTCWQYFPNFLKSIHSKVKTRVLNKCVYIQIHCSSWRCFFGTLSPTYPFVKPAAWVACPVHQALELYEPFKFLLVASQLQLWKFCLVKQRGQKGQATVIHGRRLGDSLSFRCWKTFSPTSTAQTSKNGVSNCSEWFVE